MSGDTHVAVSSVIPVLFNLANKILKENQDDSTLTRNIKKIIDYVEKMYADIKTREILNIATFLGFLLKVLIFLETVHDNIIDQGMEIFSSHGLSDAAASSQTNHIGTQGGQEPAIKKKTIAVPAEKNWINTSCNRTHHAIVHLFSNYKLKLKPTKYHLNLRLVEKSLSSKP